MRDRTLEQVHQQLVAMACDRYQVQVLPPKGVELDRHGKPVRRYPVRAASADTIESRDILAWLKQRNAAGYAIYICPAPPPDYSGMSGPVILVDDLKLDAVSRMRKDGWFFASLVETSPRNYQAWVRLSDKLLPHDLVVVASQLLAQWYGGDSNAAKARQLGRLSGFTNSKPKHLRPDGSAPFCLLRDARPGIPEAAADVLASAQEALLQREQAARATVTESVPELRSTAHPTGDPVKVFLQARMGAHDRTHSDNQSSLDFSGAIALLSRGYSEKDIRGALTASPDLAHRHSNPDRYIERTIERARAIARVRQQREETPAQRPGM